MNANEAIKNLQTMSEVLEKAANSPKNYNTEYAHYLEIMSRAMEKHAIELQELNYIYGVAL